MKNISGYSPETNLEVHCTKEFHDIPEDPWSLQHPCCSSSHQPQNSFFKRLNMTKSSRPTNSLPSFSDLEDEKEMNACLRFSYALYNWYIRNFLNKKSTLTCVNFQQKMEKERLLDEWTPLLLHLNYELWWFKIGISGAFQVLQGLINSPTHPLRPRWLPRDQSLVGSSYDMDLGANGKGGGFEKTGGIKQTGGL